MEKIRKPFQGVWNIICFNWQFYVLAILATVFLFLFGHYLNGVLRTISDILVLAIIGSTTISLVVSCYIYDFSELYKLSWLDNLLPIGKGKIVNINAGFDETSQLLKSKFADSELVVLDFYDPVKHTEVSIKRARKAYPPYPNTRQVQTNALPLQNDSAENIFLVLSAHEIRNNNERIFFFKELRRAISATGQIIVTEHLRDTANFMAYNIGFLHFHSKSTWLNTFHLAGLSIVCEIKITPFITTFILDKNGTAT